MKIIQLDEKQIKGISIRTNNARELNPETSSIGQLYQNFDKNVPVDYKNGARVYGVYYNYDSDHSGDYSVLAGVDKITEPAKVSLEKVSLVPGNYLVFEAKGEVPQVVIDTWTRVWDYFSSDTAQHERAYTTDFEYYKNADEIEIHIAIK
ncbi:MAG: GyrI-like domain-containing protein [Gammaproteobacteria bacterium]|nr:GyrI-like domain-containing protein [Gammaproteobacteria bacterium]